MQNLRIFFKNHFDTHKIGDARIKKFTETHIHRLTANNTGGKYTAMIAATQTAYDTYYGSIAEKDSELSTQRAKTLTVDTIIAEFKDNVQQQEGLIRSKFHDGSPQYIEFFPHGLTEYTAATKMNIDTLMQRITHFGAVYEPELGGAFLQLFEQLYNNYKIVRGAQLDTISEVDKDRKATSVKRDVVEKQLMRNVLALGSEYLGDPDMVEVFFDQNILHTDESGTETFWVGNIDASATVTIVERAFTAGTRLLLKNTGEAQLSFCLAPAEGIACGNNNIVVDGMSEKQISVEDLGNIVNTFFNVTNMNVNEEGRFEAEIVA